jgi:Ca2+-binding EF-hand superfamily protein
VYPRDEVFSLTTRLDFKELWRTHLRVEASAEHLRQKLQHKPLFNVYDAFKTCDINEDGIVTDHEIKRLMESRGFYVSDKEVSTLMDKFDKNRDGRISYSEFMEEILPKSPSKAF